MKKVIALLSFLFFLFLFVFSTPDVIDVGDSTKQRASYCGGTTSYIGLINPANASGTIDYIEFYVDQTVSAQDYKVGVFYNTAGNFYTCRSVVTLSVTGDAGTKVTFNAPGDFTAFAVVTGDIVGFYTGVVANRIQRSTDNIGQGFRYIETTDATDGGSYEFGGVDATEDLAFYMTGETEEAEENAIFFGINFLAKEK